MNSKPHYLLKTINILFLPSHTTISLLSRIIIYKCRYWHRSLNPKKLIEVKFSQLARNMTMQRTLKLYRLPEETKTPGFRPLEQKDIKQAYQLLNKVCQNNQKIIFHLNSQT